MDQKYHRGHSPLEDFQTSRMFEKPTRSTLETSENKIIAMPGLVYEEDGIVVLSIYQDKYILTWFRKNFNEEYYYQKKIYLLRHFLTDVIEYSTEKIKDLFNYTVKDWIIFSEAELLKTLRQDAMLPEEYGPKAIILVLSEKEFS